MSFTPHCLGVNFLEPRNGKMGGEEDVAPVISPTSSRGTGKEWRF